MVADRRIVGGVLLLIGAASMVPQVFTAIPAQGVFVAGLLVAVVGGVVLCDGERRS